MTGIECVALVVGAEEESSRSVNVRNRDCVEKGKGVVSGVGEVVAKLLELKKSQRNDNQLCTE